MPTQLGLGSARDSASLTEPIAQYLTRSRSGSGWGTGSDLFEFQLGSKRGSAR